MVRSARTGNRLFVVLAALLAVLAGIGPTGSGSVIPVAAAAGVSISVEPASGLVDGQKVTVSGDGYSSLVVMGVCPVGLSDRDAEICAHGQYLKFAEADSNGSFTVEVEVPAMVHHDDSLAMTDCRAEPCELVALDADQVDPPVLARHPLDFDPDGDLLARPTLTVTPTTGLVDGQRLQVTGAGFDASFGAAGWVHVVQCAATASLYACRPAGDGAISATGGFSVLASVRTEVRVDGSTQRLDCRSTAVVCRLGVSSADSRRAVPVTLTFSPQAPARLRPVLNLAPTSGLVDGQEIHFEGHGFEPGEYLAITQCVVSDSGSPSACTELDGDVLVDRAGVMQGAKRVRQVLVPHPEDPGIPVDCGVGRCEIWVYNADEQITVPLHFARSSVGAAASPARPGSAVAGTPGYTG